MKNKKYLSLFFFPANKFVSRPPSAPRAKNGFSLLIALLVMSMAMTTVLTLAGIFIREVRVTRHVRQSAQAFYAAETGIERYLWEYRRNRTVDKGTYACTSDCPANSTTYSVEYDFQTTNRILSTGASKEVKRAIEITF